MLESFSGNLRHTNKPCVFCIRVINQIIHYQICEHSSKTLRRYRLKLHLSDYFSKLYLQMLIVWLINRAYAFFELYQCASQTDKKNTNFRKIFHFCELRMIAIANHGSLFSIKRRFGGSGRPLIEFPVPGKSNYRQPLIDETMKHITSGCAPR